MSATLERPRAAGPPVSPLPQVRRSRFPARQAAGDWLATRQPRDVVLRQLTRAPFALERADSQNKRVRGHGMLLDWLADQPGTTWQERWLASGADPAGTNWRQAPARWLHERGEYAEWRPAALSASLVVAICADVIRPSLEWFVSGAAAQGHLVPLFTRSRDPEGFARLRAHCEADPDVSPAAARLTLYRTVVIVAAKGGVLDDIAVGDVLEFLDAEAQARTKVTSGTAVFYRMLHKMGIFGEHAPTTLRELRAAGQRTPEELIDRYQLACRPIRNLLVEYLRERQPALDYTSLESLAYHLGKLFWADIERHEPGNASLHLPVEVADAWKQRLRTRPKTIRSADGGKVEIAVDRINYRECLTPVRALYLDLAQWAVEDPGRWGPWVAPCPVGAEEINRRKHKRQRKSRMDARTRDRLPVLPVLVRTVDQRRKTAEALLAAARRAQPGDAFTAAGQTLTRSVTPHAAASKVWADDPATGKRRDLTREEDRAFWAWATVEVLRATGIRVEELLELSHHSLVQYRLPTSGELVPLLQIAPSKTDAERILLVSPELADVLSTIIRRIRQPSGAVPPVVAYDVHECVWSTPLPLLFQHRVRSENGAITPRQRPQNAHRRPGTHRPDRPGDRRAVALHAARFPQDVHHRRRPQRPATAHRPDHRRPPRHQRHPRLQGCLPRRGDPGAPGVPGPPPCSTADRGIPRPYRHRMAGVSWSLRTAQGFHRNLRTSVRHPLHP